MGHSRITLATLLALGLLGTVQAEDAAREPFFVELKGPDEPAPPVVNSQPMAQPIASPVAQPDRTTSQPLVRQVATANAGSYGPVRPTDTLWSLASKYRPSNRISIYQTMVAIYEKNPRSFADGNINHILVGSRILLPTVAEASVITDAQARARFRSDNASWKGLSPKYLANKQAHAAKPVAAEPVKQVAAKPKPVKAPPAPLPVAKAAPVPAPVVAPQPAAETQEVAKVNVPAPKEAVAPAMSAANATTPAPLPSDLDKPVGKPATEMTLALEDANAQLAQVSEMNHRLKLRLQSLTEEVETLKAQLQDQTALQKEIAELKARPVPPVVAAPEPKQNWLMDLLSSPLNLAMIILLPVLLVLAMVTLWLRARARRELEEQEKSLSESTAMMMEQDQNEFEELISLDVTDNEMMHPVPDLNTPDGFMPAEPAASAQPDLELVFSDEGEVDLQEFEPEQKPAPAASRDPDLVPDLDLALEQSANVASAPSSEVNAKPKAEGEVMSEEELQAALFAELDAELMAEPEPDLSSQGKEAGVGEMEPDSFDLSDLDTPFDEAVTAVSDEAIDFSMDGPVDEMPAALEQEATKSKVADTDLEPDPNELALSDFEDAFTEVESHPADVKPREQAQQSDYVEIDKLLAEADASAAEQEPYQGFSLDVGLDGFPEVLPESNGFDVDADDGGVGAKLDLARAYLEIDDKESARELLQEAVAQGSEHQRAEAEKLLKRLG
ncbi:MAG: FimV/HubP family polar landmark protein [Aeromonas sp.]